MLEFALDNPEIPIGIVTDQHLKRWNFLSMLFLLMVSKWPMFACYVKGAVVVGEKALTR